MRGQEGSRSRARQSEEQVPARDASAPGVFNFCFPYLTEGRGVGGGSTLRPRRAWRTVGALPRARPSGPTCLQLARCERARGVSLPWASAFSSVRPELSRRAAPRPRPCFWPCVCLCSSPRGSRSRGRVLAKRHALWHPRRGGWADARSGTVNKLTGGKRGERLHLWPTGPAASLLPTVCPRSVCPHQGRWTAGKQPQQAGSGGRPRQALGTGQRVWACGEPSQGQEGQVGLGGPLPRAVPQPQGQGTGAGIPSPQSEAGPAPEPRPPACSAVGEPQAGGLAMWGVSSCTPTWPHLAHSSGPEWLRLGSTPQCFCSEFPLCPAPCWTFQKLPREATPRPVPLATMVEEGTWAHRWSSPRRS